MQEQVVPALEAFGVGREVQLVTRVDHRSEQNEAIHDFVVQEIADGQMSAEHVLAEDPAVPAEPHALGVEHDLRRAAEVAHDVAALARDLLEEETLFDVETRDDGEVFDGRSEKAVMDDRADHRPILENRD